MRKPISDAAKSARHHSLHVIAAHEAGRAIVAVLTPGFDDDVSKVSIIPRSSGSGGITLFTPTDERAESGMYSLRYLRARLAVALGGRAAEEIIFGTEETTTSSASDLQQVRSLARRMIAEWGFHSNAALDPADTDAPIAWEPPNSRDGFFVRQSCSHKTEQRIDAEVSRLTRDAYDVAYKVLSDNRALLGALIDKLLEEETVEAAAFHRMVLEYVHVHQGAKLNSTLAR